MSGNANNESGNHDLLNNTFNKDGPEMEDMLARMKKITGDSN